jgi:hypothetical protein
MWRESSAPSSQETRGQTPKALPFCSMSSASWSEWATRSRQEYSARLKWAQHTNASASLFSESAQTSRQGGASLSTGSWNTPRVGLAHAPRGGGNPHSAEYHLRLENQVQMDQPWPTPRALTVHETAEQHITRAQKPSARNRGPSLMVAVQMDQPWPTPSTQETQHYEMTLTATGKRAGVSEGATSHSVNLCDAPMLATYGPRDEEPNSTIGSLHESPQEMYKGTLNPRWVETLMGLPVGWTMPSCACPVTPWLMSYASSGTEWSQQQQSEPSESCGHSSTPLEDEEDEGY